MRISRWAFGCFVTVVFGGGALVAACSADSSSSASSPEAGGDEIDGSGTGGDGSTVVDSGSSDGGNDASNLDASDAATCPNGAYCFEGNLYVADFTAGDGGVRVYTSPVTSAAIATPFLADAGIVQASDVAFDPVYGKLAIVDSSHAKVVVFDTPISASSTPLATLTPSQNPTGCAFDTSGRLYVSQFSAVITMYTPPFTSPTEVSTTLAGWANLFGIATDPAGGSIAIAGIGPNNTSIAVIPAPLTVSSTPSAVFADRSTGYYAGVAFQPDSGILYAAHSQQSHVRTFLPPLTDSSLPNPDAGYVVGAGPWRVRFAPTRELIVPLGSSGLRVVDPQTPSNTLVQIQSAGDVRGAAIAP